MDASIRLEYELLAVETENEIHGMIELAAPPAPPGAERQPLHLALVIDRSGSMEGPKLAAAGACADFLLEHLAPSDELAVVTYDNRVELNVPLQQKAALDGLAISRHLRAGGQTNLSGGWLKGVEVLGGASGAGPRKVILLSDGLANVGITQPETLAQMAHSTAETGVQTTTIGFGDGFDEDLMTQMADAGLGNAHFAATPDEAAPIFAEEFDDLVSLVAQNVSVELRPGSDVALLQVLNDYPVAEVVGGLQILIGDVYAGSRPRVVFKMRVPGMATLGPATVAEAVIRYVSIAERSAAHHELRLPITVNLVSASEAAAAQRDAEVTDHVVVLLAARAQMEARGQADRGDRVAASRTLRDAAAMLREKARSSASGEELRAQAAHLESQGAALRVRYDAMTRKQMTYESRRANRDRRRDR